MESWHVVWAPVVVACLNVLRDVFTTWIKAKYGWKEEHVNGDQKQWPLTQKTTTPESSPTLKG